MHACTPTGRPVDLFVCLFVYVSVSDGESIPYINAYLLLENLTML